MILIAHKSMQRYSLKKNILKNIYCLKIMHIAVLALFLPFLYKGVWGDRGLALAELKKKIWLKHLIVLRFPGQQ